MKETEMKTICGFLFVVLALASGFVAADWSPQDEQSCDQNTAGHFKYYVLSLSWSPEFCRSHPSQKNEMQCKQQREFIVHGLWPECGSGIPQSCANGGQADEIDKQKIYAFMPSDYLIQHEWNKHGTCSGLDRSDYFDLTGEVFGKLKFPRLSGAPKADKIEALFIENNTGLDADEIYLSCSENGPKRSNNTLDEVRICIDTDTHEFTRCEDAKDTCRNLKKVTVTRAK
jgi:ribonuclease T2